MLQAFAPRRPRGTSWVWLAVVLVGLIAPAGRAQSDRTAPPKGAEAKAKAGADAKSKAGAEAKTKAGAETKAQAKADESSAPAGSPPGPVMTEPEDAWQDPRAVPLLKNQFEEIKPVNVPPAEETAVRQGRADRGQISRYIQRYASDLTRHANLDAFMDPAGKPGQARAIHNATTNLVEPLLAANNPGFRREYVQELLRWTPQLLRGHLHSRVMAMVVLSRANDPQLVPTFIDQLNDPEQVVSVKLLAAVGLANLARANRGNLGGQETKAAAALAEFLRREPDVFFWAHVRALEALGAIGLAVENPARGQPTVAAAVLPYLLDPKAKPEVRSWAGWALGMMQIPANARGYNFTLVAHGIGQAAADIGTRITQVPLTASGELAKDAEANTALRNRNFPQVRRLADLLVRLLIGLSGDPEVRTSGLARQPGLGDARSFVDQVTQRVRAVASAAVGLTQAAGGQIPERQKELAASVDALRALLAQRPPANRVLFPGLPAQDQVAGAPKGQ